MFECIDQSGRKVVIKNFPPKRIVSLVPSQTELLFDLGLDEEVVGITKFCVHPEKWFRTKTRIGGTKNIDVEKIKTLQPDLIIANKEENVKEQVELLEKNAPVYVSDINNLEDALQMIEAIGKITNKNDNANKITATIKERFSKLSLLTVNQQLSTLYLIWRNPYMTVGGDTFIAEMLRCCGFRNVFENEKRYPEISLDQLSTNNCQLILLSSEPYPFREKHIDEIKKVLPEAKIILVDGEMFSWYGSRLIHAAEYFKALIDEIKKEIHS
jgi:ABC-type Fe3+-hydroxamate transport system substrate-binding protein